LGGHQRGDPHAHADRYSTAYIHTDDYMYSHAYGHEFPTADSDTNGHAYRHGLPHTNRYGDEQPTTYIHIYRHRDGHAN
jgi:hypothetical protein